MWFTLIGRDNKQLYRPPEEARAACLAAGGHRFYFNGEFGDMWCYDCGGVWHLKAEGWQVGEARTP